MKEEIKKIDLPPGWKKLNFYSRNLAYCFFVFFVPLQIPSVVQILVKGFGQEFYNTLNAWVTILLLITSAGAGILGFNQMLSIKKIINILENNDNGSNTGNK